MDTKMIGKIFKAVQEKNQTSDFIIKTLEDKWFEDNGEYKDMVYALSEFNSSEEKTRKAALGERMLISKVDQCFDRKFLNMVKSAIYHFETEFLQFKPQSVRTQSLTWQRDWLRSPEIESQVSIRPVAYPVLDFTYKYAPIYPIPDELKYMAKLSKRKMHRIKKNKWQYATILTNREFYSRLNQYVRSINNGKRYSNRYYKAILDAFCSCDVFFKLHAWRGGTVLAVGYYTRAPYTKRLYRAPVARKDKCYKKLLKFREHF